MTSATPDWHDPGVTIRLTVADGARARAGVVRPDESWLDAAQRISPDDVSCPVAFDLGGEVKRFVIDRAWTVALRPMTLGDLPALTRWRQSAHVRAWWGADGEPSADNVAAQYAPDIELATPTRIWAVEVNGRSIGFVQDYRIRDYPDYALLTPDPDAIGFDYAIGEPAWLGRGLGTRLIWTWMLETRRRFPTASAYFAAPDHRNGASLRALARCGFTQGAWFDEPQPDGSVATVIGCSLDVATVLG